MVKNIYTYAGMQWYGCLILTVDCIMAKHIAEHWKIWQTVKNSCLCVRK
jgi:hypothetical protein